MSAPVSGAFTSPPGGVMTAGPEGAITGELVVRLLPDERDAGRVRVCVAYAQTDEWHPVAGPDAPASIGLDEIIAHLARDRGCDEHGNPRPSDLSGLGA